ncbi:hypothetical protein KH172YL63_12350 [Bacillus sp. KH172YL63]|nr:hypothetical protein KH172YL63_12350 [Bacillus sp. KH172YL63]
MFKGCIYCGHNSLEECELYIGEGHGGEIGKSEDMVGGNVAYYSCERCGYLHPFLKEKRKKFERESAKKAKHLRLNIR